jgi:catechol 2,3-dioxygenase-like lactoylglutathione lyase family enzyme
MTLKMEHVALNVPDPTAMADWYCKHLGLEIARSLSNPPYTHFLRDSEGSMMMEIYKNPPDQVPEYGKMHHLLLHLAFVSADIDTDKARLLGAGATLVQDETLADGSRLVMLRDPWGLSIQLCRRATPMLRTH